MCVCVVAHQLFVYLLAHWGLERQIALLAICCIVKTDASVRFVEMDLCSELLFKL